MCHYFWKVVLYQKDCPRSKPRTGNAFKWIRGGRMKSATVAVYAGSETQFGRTAFDEADLQTGSWLLHLSELRKSEQSRETFLRPGKHEGSQSALHLLQLASNENCHTTGHVLRWRQTKTKNQINLFLAAMLRRSSKRAKLAKNRRKWFFSYKTVTWTRGFQECRPEIWKANTKMVAAVQRSVDLDPPWVWRTFPKTDKDEKSPPIKIRDCRCTADRSKSWRTCMQPQKLSLRMKMQK